MRATHDAQHVATGELMLIDQKLDLKTVPRDLCSRPQNMFTSLRFSARRYLFDDGVVEKVGALVHEYPTLFFRNYQFAIPSFETIYIEFDHKKWMEGIGYPDSVLEDNGNDLRVGYMLHKGTLAVIGNTTSQPDPMPLPLLWTLDYRKTYPDRDMFPMNMVDSLFFSVALGSTFGKEGMTQEIMDDLKRRITLWLPRGMNKTTVQAMLRGSAGEIRVLLCLLLWLNQPKIIDYVDVPHKRGMTRRGPITYMKHTVVKLKPGVLKKQMMRGLTGPRRPPRRHEAAGSLRTWGAPAAGCPNPDGGHPWPILPDDNGVWHCPKCPAKRKWWPKYEKGDASLGFVKHDNYRVMG